ncbi:hypothetical protein IV56_GL002213 [Lacticaseibacillus saniviri JCM 17471 = DSM 24301]|uniref:Short chain dehydrogenase n=2 Tax=Lacticaseibacillus saniviri TaxID=931533 RepID=A0A0R2MVS1_9LACO|nr:hypothetical protein IV56_GL002213 [Lacticaseibacillus saniviri JCM 17471 = DSM 24301]
MRNQLIYFCGTWRYNDRNKSNVGVRQMANKVLAIYGVGKSGLGQALGEVFGKQGYTVALLERDQDHLKQVQSALEAEGITASAVPVDLSNFDSVTQSVEAIAKLGDLDTVIFNATMRRKGRPSTFTGADIMQDLTVNVGSAVQIANQTVPLLKETKGAILFTNSVVASKPGTTDTSQSMGKAAVHNFALSLNKDLQKDGVFAGLVNIWTYIREGNDGKQNPTTIAQAFYDQATQRTEPELIYGKR